MAVRPICEHVDLEGTRLHVAVRLPGLDVSGDPRFALTLITRSGTVVARSTASLQPRVSAVGEWTNTALRFVIDLDRVPCGSFRFEVAPTEARGRGWVVEPTTGLLASSRRRRYGRRLVQCFPSAGKPVLWLRVASDTSVGRIGWSVRNVLRDVAFVAHGRRFCWVRLARLVTKPLVPAGPIWLIGERPETARDNGHALFAHLRRVRPHAAVYYLITADSPMREVVAPLGNVLDHSSLRHRILMLHADVLANAYSIKHMLPRGWHPGAYMWQASWRIGAQRVYLKHGVHLSPYAMKRASGGYDLVATVGPGEAAALEATSGYSRQLVQTGLARYDALLSPGRPSRTILFMPTWRRYLVPSLFSGKDDALTSYEGSNYQRFVRELLGSPDLAALLHEHDLTFQIVPHYNLASVLQAPPGISERIQLLTASTVDIPALLRSCDLLVTDYSSVQFDVAYLGTPVVYCQFDAEEYAAGHSAFSWFEAGADGFGPVAVDVESTIDAIARYAETGFKPEQKYVHRTESVFAHRDRRNCERLVTAIDALEE